MAVNSSRSAVGGNPSTGREFTRRGRCGALGDGVAAVVIQPYPTPHRDDLFSEINRLAPGSVDFWFLSSGSKGRPWLSATPQCPYPAAFMSDSLIESRHWRRGAREVFRRLREAKPRVVICGYEHPEYWGAFLWGRLNASRTLCWMGTTGYEPRPLLRRTVRNSLLRSLDGLILYSSLTEKFALSAGLAKLPRYVVPNASDTSKFHMAPDQRAAARARIRKELQLEEDDFVVLYAGRLSQEKNLEMLVEGFARATQTTESGEEIRLRLVMVGSGPSELPLRERIERQRLRPITRWRTGVPPDRLPAYFAAADMFALVSLHEPWGIVVNEAAAAGLPTVVSPRCGAAYHLFPGPLAALVVPPDEPQVLSEAILRLARDKAFRGQMGELLRHSERQLSVRWMAHHMLSILDLSPSDISDTVASRSNYGARDVS